jgi:hypothetical protein
VSFSVLANFAAKGSSLSWKMPLLMDQMVIDRERNQGQRVVDDDADSNGGSSARVVQQDGIYEHEKP